MGSKTDKTAGSINRATLHDIKNIEIQRFRDIDTGTLEHPFFLKPCRVKILMLVDDGISYNQFYFGLSEVLDTLRNNPEWWVKFDITRAHRSTDPNQPLPGSPAEALYAPHYENFAFDQAGFNLDNFDQVWFYGFNSSQNNTSGAVPPALKESELEILFRWMDNGGGVFATGDHYTLGASLCSRIPRVRNMRKWTTADGVPNNFGPDRHDTLLKGHDYASTPAVDESTRYTFDDESDDIPMRLRLRWYNHHHFGWLHHHYDHWHWPYFWHRTPHPVMCGKDGPISILPDHPHEGEVVVPTDLTDNITHGTYTAPEYPPYSGSPLSPEIIAWAKVQDDHGPAPISFKGSANSKEFGAVGAYNGHIVDVGRVVVDSTWHHWFDVNLTGRMFFNTDTPGSVETNDLRKLNGFNDTPAGIVALNRIRNYYRNVAIWLSPKAKQKCMALRACWNSLYRYPLYADLRADLPIWVIGHHATEVLGKYAGHCHVKGWWPVIFERIPLDRIFDPDNIRIPVETLRMIDDFMIGGILKTMLIAREEGKYRKKLPDENALIQMAEQGAQMAIKEMIEYISLGDKSNQHLQSILKRSLG
jgi:hypothetical protein